MNVQTTFVEKICHKASPLGSASDFYILNIQSPFGHFIAVCHKPSSIIKKREFNIQVNVIIHDVNC